MCTGECENWVSPTGVVSPFARGAPYCDVGTQRLSSHLATLTDSLEKVCSQIHANPELGFEEYKTHDLLVDYLEKQGFSVTPNAFGLDTAWKATFQQGKEGTVIGFNSEMDALPKLGHACGHNLIAVAGVAAAVTLAKVLQELDQAGKIVLLGTPAEESGGGKSIMLKEGAYDEMDICMMTHPTPQTGFTPMFARARGTFDFRGAPAHAAAGPQTGRNSLDACVTAYNSISMLRQQVLPTTRIHLNIISVPGHPINVIPDDARLEIAVRALDMDEFARVTAMVVKCAEGAAMSTNTELTQEWSEPYTCLDHNLPLAAEYARFMQKDQGEIIPWIEEPVASTDFGNVSKVLPCIHPNFSIMAADKEAVNHTHEFTELAGRHEAFVAAMNAAKGLAAVGWRAVVDSAFLSEVKRGFKGDHSLLNSKQ